jgi:hypothetical protein
MNARAMPRLKKRLKLWLAESLAFTADVSATGFAIDLVRALKPGAMVHGRLEVDGVQWPFTGQVRWARAPEPRLQERGKAGVRLTGIEPAFYRWLAGS